jgi:16S rRNA (guanine966-N2)-methyltransferase
MLDRVREALFATLTPWIDGARVLDLFAGSGSLALEALSRGAGTARLVEQQPATLRVLQDNVAALGQGERTKIVHADALAPASWGRRTRYDLIFLDPPYAMLETPASKRKVLDALTTLVREHLETPGYLVLHAPRRLLRETDFPPGTSVALREYGSTALWYLNRSEDEPPG